MKLARNLIAAALFGVPLALSFVPGLPPHGYGHVLLALPLVACLGRPRLLPRIGLYAAGIALQTLAYPEPDLGFLGWILLWPYLFAREREDGANGWRAAFLYGFARAVAGFYWLGDVHFTAWAGTALGSAIVFTACFEGGMRYLRFLPYAFRVGLSWAFFEGVHGWFLGGLPWLYLAHTQWRFLAFVQAADVVGAAGLGFLMAWLQGAAFDARRRRRPLVLAAPAALAAAALAYGATRVGEPAEGGPGVLMVQSAEPHGVKELRRQGPEPYARAMVQRTLDGLAAHPDARLVVWPETMFPYDYVEGVQRQAFTRKAEQFARLFLLPAIYGTGSYADLESFEKRRGYNAAVLVDAAGDVTGIYRKQRLVPMGEHFLPRRVLPESWADALLGWLRRNVGYPDHADLVAGDGFTTLQAGPGLSCAILICFESLYPSLTRGAVLEGDPDLVLHLANHGWFGDTWQQRQAVPIWVFRAVETRTPFLSCANAGVTCAVDATGRVRAVLDRVMEPGVLFTRVPPRLDPPPYLGWGRWLLPAGLAVAVAACLAAGRKARRSGSGPP